MSSNDVAGCFAGQKLDVQSWAKNIIEDRNRRSSQFIDSPVTYLAGTGHYRHDGQSDLNVHVSDTDLLCDGHWADDVKVQFSSHDGIWKWRVFDPKVTPVYGGISLESDETVMGAIFQMARFTLQIWKCEPNRLELGIFDRNRNAVHDYKGLSFFPPEIDYRFQARYVRLKEAEHVSVLTAGSGERDFFKVARIHFSLNDEVVSLTAYKSGPNSKLLFIPFRDSTSGKDTYGAGRYLNVEEPDDDHIVLDFNDCVNFPCAYAPDFHCPIPPQENWLSVGIEAGEKTYPL